MDGLDTLLPQIHPVDRDATRIWFTAYGDHLDPARVDSSHRFLYGHRFWSRVRAALLTQGLVDAAPVTQAIHLADAATRTARVDGDQLLGIAAVAVRTVGLVGMETFAAAPGHISVPKAALLETPSQVLRRRARSRPEGLLGAWRGDSRRWKVTVEEDPGASYAVQHGHPLAPCRGGDHEGCRVGVLAGLTPGVHLACRTLVRGQLTICRL